MYLKYLGVAVIEQAVTDMKSETVRKAIRDDAKDFIFGSRLDSYIDEFSLDIQASKIRHGLKRYK